MKTRFTRSEVIELLRTNDHHKLKGSDLSNLDLSGIDFKEGIYTGTNFSGSNLTNANFTRTNVANCNFTNAILDDANFKFARMEYNTNTNASVLGLVVNDFEYPIYFPPTNNQIHINHKGYAAVEWASLSEPLSGHDDTPEFHFWLTHKDEILKIYSDFLYNRLR